MLQFLGSWGLRWTVNSLLFGIPVFLGKSFLIVVRIGVAFLFVILFCSMENDAKKASGIGKNGLVSAESPILRNHVDGEVQSGESAALLPSRKGGILRNKEKVRRKVQWNDNNGNKLAEVLVFDPSDAGDSDSDSDSDSDDIETCVCSIM